MATINRERLERRIVELGKYGENEQGGIDRSIGSSADLQARKYLKKTWENMGLRVCTDAIANMWASWPGSESGLKPITVGSHHDAVPNGGKYDGALGVLLATEVLQTLQDNQIQLKHPYQIVSFTAEEPNPFNLSTMGSRSVTGKITKEQLLNASDGKGNCLADAILQAGGDIQKIEEDQLEVGDFAAFLECHIEQGRNLFDRGLSVATVSCITGIYREIISIHGEANHAGTTMMQHRHDALLAATEFALVLENEAVRQNRSDVVATVGKFDVFPNSANIIPGNVQLIMEIRTPSREIRDKMLQRITSAVRDIERHRGVKFERKVNLDQAEVVMDSLIQNAISDGCASVQNEEVKLVSMAGHDSVHMSGIARTGMLFVQSVNGISHSNKEFTKIDDIECAGNAMVQAILNMDAWL